MATSPSDQNNRNVLAWLDRLQSSVRTAGGKGGPQAFKALRENRGASDEESDGEQHKTHAERYGLVSPVNNDGDNGDDEDETLVDDKLSSLPESHVPLGLIANLSLSNSKAKNARKEQKDAVVAEENLDDDDVVCIHIFFCFCFYMLTVVQGVANETYFMPGLLIANFSRHPLQLICVK